MLIKVNKNKSFFSCPKIYWN